MAARSSCAARAARLSWPSFHCSKECYTQLHAQMEPLLVAIIGVVGVLAGTVVWAPYRPVRCATR
jgi:hypothetical protein